VGGGLEALQFAYFCRRPAAVSDPSFVKILDGDAFALPVADASVDVVAQNCL